MWIFPSRYAYFTVRNGPAVRIDPMISPETTSSTRRFCWRPAAVSFVATGMDSPKPFAVTEPAGIPALDASTVLIRAGADCRSIFDAACEVYEAAGYPTQRTKTAGEVLDRGFFHGLGHGVGLEVHEGPSMGLSASGELVAGDIVTIEPGCYDPAIGGVRLEDLVLVTDDGCEVLTRFPYDLEAEKQA